MEFIQIYDEGVAQYAYLIGCEETREAVIFDPQREISEYLELAEAHDLKITAVAETHIHADFLTGTEELLNRVSGITAYLSPLGEKDGWGYEWAAQYGNAVTYIRDGESFVVGKITVTAVHTPGHTPEHLTFLVTDAGQSQPMGAITGDFVFVGDLGRPDLLETAAKAKGAMKKGAEDLYKSVEKFISQPEHLLIWPGHGAGSACGKTLGSMPHSSWGYEKHTNPALDYSDRDGFISYITDDQVEPPLYFARMKALNKAGKPLLSSLPSFERFTADELPALLADDSLIVLDARPDKDAVMAAHLPNSFGAPFSSMFSTAAGSVIEDPERPLLLVISDENSYDAWRRLINIGFNRVIGYITPESLARYFAQTADMETIESTDFSDLKDLEGNKSYAVIDVRSGTEYAEGHIENAINAPYTRLPEFLDKIPTDKRLLLHCGSGMRASVASLYLAREGYDVIHVSDLFENYCQGKPNCGLKVAS